MRRSRQTGFNDLLVRTGCGKNCNQAPSARGSPRGRETGKGGRAALPGIGPRGVLVAGFWSPSLASQGRAGRDSLLRRPGQRWSRSPRLDEIDRRELSAGSSCTTPISVDFLISYALAGDDENTGFISADGWPGPPYRRQVLHCAGTVGIPCRYA